VVVSANLTYQGLPAAIMDLAANKKFLMCVSEAVLAEYKEVLNRPRLRLAPHRIAGALAVIRKTSLYIRPTRTVADITVDESDNRLLECAQAARADYLVTGNVRRFPKTYLNTAIVTPRQFMDLLFPQLVQS
jgi:putative PIN family toxin of toxin-antitoxin system